MRVRLPIEDRWSPEFQRKLNGELERALERLNEYALVPYGGTTGQVLMKSTDRPFVMEWGDGGGGGGAIPWATREETDAGVLTTKALNPDVGAYAYDRIRWPAQHTAGKGTASVVLTPSSGVVTVDGDDSNVFELTLAENVSFATPANPKNGQTVNILLRQDATGGRTVTFNSAWTFTNRIDPVLSTDANAVDLLSCQWDATAGVMRCTLLPNFGAGYDPPATGADLTFSNVGGANEVVKGVVGSDVRFRTFAADGDLTMTTDGDVIRVSYTAPATVSTLNDLTDVDAPAPQNGDMLAFDGTAWVIAPPRKFTLGATWTNGANVLAPGVNRVHAVVSEKSTILGWYILTDSNFGSCSVGIKRVPFSSYPPGSGDSITGSDDPAVDNNYAASSFDMSAWDVVCEEGDVLTFELLTTSLFKSVQLVLVMQRSY